MVHCWICGSEKLRLVKPANFSEHLTSNSFAITDSAYGVTAAIYQCASCEFLQCSDLAEVLPFYEKLVDSSYEAGREQRSSQARKVLEVAQELQPSGRLLDIGAGSGMLVEQAIQMGYRAEGIEPSEWLQQLAQRRNLPVHLGTFPHPAVPKQFDIITLIDVIEHVSDPLTLLRNIATSLSDNGIAMVVTPDVGSIAARILGWKWWHFRVAHIGYFNKRSLLSALNRAGMRPVIICRPGWVFTIDYLYARARRYLPKFLRIGLPSFLRKIVIPVNFRDSWLIGCRRRTQKAP